MQLPLQTLLLMEAVKLAILLTKKPNGRAKKNTTEIFNIGGFYHVKIKT